MTVVWTGHTWMFQLFLRARAHKYFKGRPDDNGFKARSAGRDAETDRVRVASILNAIDHALHAAEQEQTGLNRRVEDVLGRAAVTIGNGTDEYMEREPFDSHHQNLFGFEILNGQRRLKELATTITHFKFVRTVMLSRFPDYKPPTTA